MKWVIEIVFFKVGLLQIDYKQPLSIVYIYIYMPIFVVVENRLQIAIDSNFHEKQATLRIVCACQFPFG